MAHREPFPTMARSSMGGITAPQHPPVKYSENTLIHITVRVKPDTKASSSSSKSKPFRTLKSKLGIPPSCPEDVRVIRLPRSEYVRYFARNDRNEYIGTEPEREWSDGELEREFGRYRDWEAPRWGVGVDGNGRGVMVEESAEKGYAWKD